MTESNDAASAAAAAVPAEPPARQDLSPDLAQRIWDRVTQVGPGALTGGELIQRKQRSFILDGQAATPFFFWDTTTGEYVDVKITMRSLNSVEEAHALDGLTDPGQMPFLLAKAALHAINDTPIPRDRLDFFWEGLGMGGRQLAMMAFQEVGSASAAAVGKFRSSISVG